MSDEPITINGEFMCEGERVLGPAPNPYIKKHPFRIYVTGVQAVRMVAAFAVAAFCLEQPMKRALTNPAPPPAQSAKAPAPPEPIECILEVTGKVGITEQARNLLLKQCFKIGQPAGVH